MVFLLVVGGFKGKSDENLQFGIDHPQLVKFTASTPICRWTFQRWNVFDCNLGMFFISHMLTELWLKAQIFPKLKIAATLQLASGSRDNSWLALSNLCCEEFNFCFTPSFRWQVIPYEKPNIVIICWRLTNSGTSYIFFLLDLIIFVR